MVLIEGITITDPRLLVRHRPGHTHVFADANRSSSGDACEATDHERAFMRFLHTWKHRINGGVCPSNFQLLALAQQFIKHYGFDPACEGGRREKPSGEPHRGQHRDFRGSGINDTAYSASTRAYRRRASSRPGRTA